MTTVTATTDKRLLTKAQRFFSGSVHDRICELVQNARRAGATQVSVTCKPSPTKEGVYCICFSDNGPGVTDFNQLLTLGRSDWSIDTALSEDPAGAGFFSLAPRDVLVQSCRQEMLLTAAGWTGTPVKVSASSYKGPGLRLQFEDEGWRHQDVFTQTAFSGLDLVFNRRRLPSSPFLFPDVPVLHVAALGVKIQGVDRHAADRDFGIRNPRGRNYYDTTVLNFHGCRIFLSTPNLVREACPRLHWLIDLTGEPTPLRLKLPDRNQIFQNDAFAELNTWLTKAALLELQRRGRHTLRYSSWRTAQDLGVQLPEADPQWSVVGLGSCWDALRDDGIPAKLNEKVAGKLPWLNCSETSGSDRENLDLLAILREHTAFDYVPTEPEYGFQQYSWCANEARLEDLQIHVTPRSGDPVCWTFDSGWVTVVEAISAVLTIRCLDNTLLVRSYALPVMFDENEDVFATPDGLRVGEDVIWSKVGGWHDESETGYDALRHQFDQDMEQLLAQLVGPYEAQRLELVRQVNRLLVQATKQIVRPATVTIDEKDVVHVRAGDCSLVLTAE